MMDAAVRLGMTRDAECVITEVVADSQADTAGVQVGWRIAGMEVDGRDIVPIETNDDFVSAFAGVRLRGVQEWGQGRGSIPFKIPFKVTFETDVLDRSPPFKYDDVPRLHEVVHRNMTGYD